MKESEVEIRDDQVDERHPSKKREGKVDKGVKACLFLHIKSVYITYILQIHYIDYITITFSVN